MKKNNTDILEDYINKAKDEIETYELMDLQEVEKVIGSDNFFDIYYSIQDSLEIEDALLVLGAMDKLLNSNKSDYVTFTEGTVFRKDTPNKIRDNFHSFAISTNVIQALEDISDNLENIRESSLVNVALDLIIFGNNDDNDIEDFDEFSESVKYIKSNKGNLYSMLDNLKVIDNESKEGEHKELDFSKDSEPTDEEVLKLLHKLNY